MFTEDLVEKVMQRIACPCLVVFAVREVPEAHYDQVHAVRLLDPIIGLPLYLSIYIYMYLLPYYDKLSEVLASHTCPVLTS